jgi:lysyl-tRNA synthetase class II
MSLRGQGKIFFSDIYDGTGKFQSVFKIDNSPKYTGHDDIDGLFVFF